MHIRIYNSEELLKNKTILLDSKQSHYLKNVMRIQIGDKISLFNEISGEFLCEISILSKKGVELNVLEKTRDANSENYGGKVHVAMPLIKPHRLSFLIEKLTELGVQEITPIITNHTYSKHHKQDKLLAIAIEATEQSERVCPPIINDAQNLELLIRKNTIQQAFFLDERKNIGTSLLSNKIDFTKDIIFFIGPEGGFSEDEFNNFQAAKIKSIDLGTLILRAETACISIISIYNQMKLCDK